MRVIVTRDDLQEPCKTMAFESVGFDHFEKEVALVIIVAGSAEFHDLEIRKEKLILSPGEKLKLLEREAAFEDEPTKR